MNTEITTYVGYSASLFIVLSFILKDVRKIRVVNMIGCICFVIYGIFLNDYRDLNQWLLPVIIPNAILALVQVYYLTSKKGQS